MEQLQNLLRLYNLEHIDETERAPWEKQYCKHVFPTYWKLVYNILSPMDRELIITEIGSGLGNVTSIFCYLGFNHINSFEEDSELASFASQKIQQLFNVGHILVNQKFPPDAIVNTDILISVNCVYRSNITNKRAYLDSLYNNYLMAGNPDYYILEVIDDSYIEENEEFPRYMRLNHQDIYQMFPNAQIASWETYKYPINKKSKTLYLIQQ